MLGALATWLGASVAVMWTSGLTLLCLALAVLLVLRTVSSIPCFLSYFHFQSSAAFFFFPSFGCHSLARFLP